MRYLTVFAIILCLASTWCAFAAPIPGAAELAGLARLKNYTAGRVSSFDPSGGNADGRQDWPIQPGEIRELARLSGPGAITHIWVTIASPDKHHLRNLVIRMYWDGESAPSVESPIGDFFGLGHAQYYQYASIPIQIGTQNGLNCFWRMPFQKDAVITLTNEGPDPVGAFYYYIDYQSWPQFPKNTALFHAQYRQEFPCKPGENYLFMEAEGQGHYVGCNLSIHNRADGWWGEGDDMIYVDGAETPQFNGTGSEDYFCGAWCYGPAFSNPYFGCPLRGEHRRNACWNVYRYHIENPIPFTQSIRVTIEHGHANDRADDFASVAYWYQTEPHKPYPPMPAAAERIPTEAIPVSEPGAIEAETELDSWTGSQPIEVQDLSAMGVFSGGSHLWFKPAEPATFSRPFTLDAAEAGSYRVDLWYTASWDYGVVDLLVNGKKAASWDGFAPNIERRKLSFDIELVAGENKIELSIPSKHADSQGYYAGIDCYRAEPR